MPHLSDQAFSEPSGKKTLELVFNNLTKPFAECMPDAGGIWEVPIELRDSGIVIPMLIRAVPVTGIYSQDTVITPFHPVNGLNISEFSLSQMQDADFVGHLVSEAHKIDTRLTEDNMNIQCLLDLEALRKYDMVTTVREGSSEVNYIKPEFQDFLTRIRLIVKTGDPQRTWSSRIIGGERFIYSDDPETMKHNTQRYPLHESRFSRFVPAGLYQYASVVDSGHAMHIDIINKETPDSPATRRIYNQLSVGLELYVPDSKVSQLEMDFTRGDPTDLGYF